MLPITVITGVLTKPQRSLRSFIHSVNTYSGLPCVQQCSRHRGYSSEQITKESCMYEARIPVWGEITQTDSQTWQKPDRLRRASRPPPQISSLLGFDGWPLNGVLFERPLLKRAKLLPTLSPRHSELHLGANVTFLA